MIYVQRVIAIVENKNIVPELEKLGQTLRRDGILFQCYQLRCDQFQCYQCQCFSENFLKDCSREIGDGCREHGTEDKHRSDERRLWITDNAEYANTLRAQGEGVLALLHADNRNQNFSEILYACENPGELDTEYVDRVYRRYKGLPWDIAETARCIIRETTEADAEAFFEIYAPEEITRYMEALHPTVESEKQYIRDYIEKVYGFYGFGVWTVLKKDTGEIIGRAGFSYREGFEEPEIGFVIGVPWQRQGYAREVCSTLLDMAEEEWGFETIQAFVAFENEASVQLCQELGLHNAGRAELNGIVYNRFLKKL